MGIFFGEIEWEIKKTEQGNDSIHDFYVKMTGLWDQEALMELQFVCATDPITFELYRQETQLVQYQLALQSDFEHVCRLLLHQSPFPELTVIFLNYLPENKHCTHFSRKKKSDPKQVFAAKSHNSQVNATQDKGSNDIGKL